MNGPRISSVFTLTIFAVWSLATELRERIAPRRIPPVVRPAPHVLADAARAERLRWN
jgi:hypothetical protein